MLLASHKKNEKYCLTLYFVAQNHLFCHFCQFRSTLNSCLHCYNKKKTIFQLYRMCIVGT